MNGRCCQQVEEEEKDEEEEEARSENALEVGMDVTHVTEKQPHNGEIHLKDSIGSPKYHGWWGLFKPNC